MTEPDVRNEPEQHRYAIYLDDALAGFAQYAHRDGRVVFTHTEIDDAFEGQGLGSKLAKAALDDVRSSGAQVVPLCPFIARWIERHADYQDLVDEALTSTLRG